MKGTWIITVFAVVLAAVLFGMYQFGLFHCLQTWPEYKFLGGSVADLDNYLKDKNIRLDIESSIECINGKTLSSKQTLYRFYGGKEHRFWFLPMGTKIYGLYVLVEDGKIISFQEFIAIDSL